MSQAALDEDDVLKSTTRDIEPVDIQMPVRQAMDDDMDITPMIDLTFLLLIFFILTSKMTAEPTNDVPPAKNGSAVSTRSCISLFVSKGAGDAPIVAKSDGTRFSDDPEQQAAEIAEYLQVALDSGAKSEVLIRAAGNVTSGQMQMVKQAVAEILEEGKMINIAVAESN
jgi:biopolymer transport protein ExbD